MTLETAVLLDGENPRTMYLEDAQHWARVYGELLVSVMGLDLQLGADGSARIQQRAGRWQERLSFWQRRCQEIAGRASTIA